MPLLPGPEPGYVPVSQGPGTAPEIAVAFAPEATEAEMRELLRTVGAEVVGGRLDAAQHREAEPHCDAQTWRRRGFADL